MSKPNVHTTPGATSDISVPSPNGCSASTTVSSVVADSAHSQFSFEGTAHFTGGNAHSCPVKLKAKANGASQAKMKKKKIVPDDSTTPDPGTVTVTLSSDPGTPQTVPVNYVS